MSDDHLVSLPNGWTLSLTSSVQRRCAEYVIKEVFEQLSYLRPGFEIRPSDTVVDVGGNVGVFSLWAASQAKRVITIEPTEAIEVLEKSLKLNQINNITTLKQAVTSYRGELEMLLHPNCNAISHQAGYQPNQWLRRLIKLFLRLELEPPVSVRCPCDTLESILQKQNVTQVDLLKIDCEGGEYAIIDSLSDTSLQGISKIVLEFHEFHPSHNHKTIVRRLSHAGFKVSTTRSWKDRLIQTGMMWASR